MKIMLQSFRVLFSVLLLNSSLLVSAQVTNPVADAAINAYNDAFLITVDGNTYYKKALNSNEHDGTWTLALDIQGMLDTYERTGCAEHKAIVNELIKSFLVLNPPPYDWDGWNDDLAWMGLILARGYEMIDNDDFLSAAESTFNLAYDRGWSTEFNDGGIWEEQPNYSNAASSKSKDALSNNPMGHLACFLYLSTGNENYLDKAIQIYDWSVSHIFDPQNGHVYAGVYRNGNLNKALTAYSQGSFIDFSALLYEITGDERMLRNAELAADYTISQLTTEDDILSTSEQHHNTWGGEFVRGLGHLLKSNPELWNKYYSFLKNNSESAWNNRRMDFNLTWNGWAIPTPEVADEIANRYVSAVALHQHTPKVQSFLGTIEAEDFNFWKGITTGNIDAGGESVKLANADDWVEYIVEIPEDGTYTFFFDVAATESASFEIQQNHITQTAVTVPATGDFQTYTSVSTGVKLTSGFHSIRFKSVSGDFDINQWSTEKCNLIQPFVSVNGAVAEAITEVTLAAGDDVSFSPESGQTGTWIWTGPGDFSADTREVSIPDISAAQTGSYTVQFVNESGCISTKDFMVSLDDCTPTSINATLFMYNEGWEESTGILDAGSFVKIAGTPSDGIWSWSGPNGFTSNSAEIIFNNIGYKEAGEFTATYYSQDGCESSLQVNVEITGDDPCSTPITPYINVDGWREGAYGSVSNGGSFQLGPQAAEGSWKWTGPGDFTSDQRELMVTDFNQTKAGTYTATFTNQMGCESTKEFVIGVEGCSSESIIPEILVDGQAWAYPDSISVTSGGSFTITPPDIGGYWSWSGDNNGGERWEGLIGFTSNERIVSFDNVLDIREGTLTLTHVAENACISTHIIDVFVVGDDYCASEITPYINVNNTGWEQASTAELKEGDRFTFGPNVSNVNRVHWEWNGPDGFSAVREREVTITDFQNAKAGTYRVTAANNIGCVSSFDFTISMFGDPANGINDVGENSEPSLYPNPATDWVKLGNIPPHSLIKIVDVNGQLIKIVEPNYMNSEVEINISGLRSGIYLITIDGEETKVLKLIKQ